MGEWEKNIMKIGLIGRKGLIKRWRLLVLLVTVNLSKFEP